MENVRDNERVVRLLVEYVQLLAPGARREDRAVLPPSHAVDMHEFLERDFASVVDVAVGDE